MTFRVVQDVLNDKTMIDLKNILGQMGNMQETAEALKQKVRTVSVTGESGAGQVRVVMNGAMEVTAVKLDPSLMAEDPEIAGALIQAAINDAVHQAQQEVAQSMSGMLPFNLGSTQS